MSTHCFIHCLNRIELRTLCGFTVFLLALAGQVRELLGKFGISLVQFKEVAIPLKLSMCGYF